MKKSKFIVVELILILLLTNVFSATEITTHCADILINNVDLSGSAINNVEYTLIDSQGTEIKRLSSDKKGLVTFSCVPNGEYQVTEVSVPSSYQNNQVTYDISIDNSVSNIAIQNTHNPPHGKVVSITLTSLSGSPISDAEYTIYDDTGNIIEVITTDENGHANSSALPPGHYFMKATKPGAGYELDTTEYEFYIDAQTRFTQYTASTSEIETNVQFVVLDQYGNSVSDVEYQLLSDGNTVATAISDSNGNIVFENVKYGDYILKETVVPSGYQSNSTSLKFSVEEDGQLSGVPSTITVSLIENYSEEQIDMDYPRLETTGNNLVFLSLAVLVILVTTRIWYRGD